MRANLSPPIFASLKERVARPDTSRPKPAHWASVNNIHPDAFDRCPSLKMINVDENISFSNEQLTEATIHFEANNLFALYGFTSSDQNTFFDFIAHNKTDEIKDLMIFVALYDANGAMIDLNCQTMTLSADSYEAFSCKLSCNLYNYLSLDFVVRLFMTDANTLQPISDVVTHVVDIYGVGPIVKPIV